MDSLNSSGTSLSASSLFNFAKPADDPHAIKYKEILQAVFPQFDSLVASTANFDSDTFVQLVNAHKTNGVLNTDAVIGNYPSTPLVGPAPQPVLEMKIILPPKEIALTLIFKTWNYACVLFRFYHRPNFIRVFNSLYDTNPEDYTDEQNKALPLIYSVIAVGALFSKEDLGANDVAAREFFQDEGYRYFIAARKLTDITNATDVYAIQTVFMLTIFLQCSAKLTTCYSYIGVALRAAITQGLHTKVSTAGKSPVEAETCKRLFWTIYKMDVYMNCILGLPRSISEEDVDQELPQDVDDDRITDLGIEPQPAGKISSCGMNNQHTKLIVIMNHIHCKLSPLKNDAPHATLPLESVHELENELQHWTLQLPLQLRPNYTFLDQAEADLYLKPNKLLLLDFLHAKIMLYRPFIHYVSVSTTRYPRLAVQRSMAQNCINTAREVVHLAREMIDKRLLSGSYWFSVHTIFFSVACLMYVTHQLKLKNTAPSDGLGSDVEKDSKVGIDVLLKLKNSSMASERTFNVLNEFFDRLNKKTVELSAKELSKLAVSAAGQGQFRTPTQGPTATFEHGYGHGHGHGQAPAVPDKYLDPLGTQPLTPGGTHTNTYLSGLFDDWDWPLGRFAPSYLMSAFADEQLETHERNGQDSDGTPRS